MAFSYINHSQIIIYHHLQVYYHQMID